MFLRACVILIGIVVLAFMLGEPQFEGRNTHASFLQIYFNDPFLAYAYIASIPFFIALYQAFRLLGYIAKSQVFTLNFVRALRTIKHCSLALITFISAAEAYLFIGGGGSDDIAGGVAMGVFLIFVSSIMATAAVIFEQLLQSAIDIRSEHDLTM